MNLPNNRKRISMPLQMLAGLGLGIVFGLFVPGISTKLAFISTIFAHGIKMVVMPLILLSVTLGTFRAGVQRAHLGKTALWSIVFFVIMTLLASSLGLGLNLLFRPGLGASLAETAAMPANLAGGIDWTKFLVDMVPANIVGALVEGNALPVLVFGVLLGSALSVVEDRAAPLVAVLESFLAALFKMIEWVIALSPFAVFASIAWLLASKGVSAITPLIKLLGIAYLGMAVLAIVLTLILKLIGLSPRAVIKQVSEPLILAFSTRSSEITFPVHLKRLTEMGVPQSVASTILPLSYIFNRDGAVLYTALAVGYLADAYHLAWSWPVMFTIVVLTIITIDGAANVPSGAIVAITAILSAVGLPAEAVLLILGIDAFFDMGRTALNVYASTVATAVAMRISGEPYSGPATDERTAGPLGSLRENT
ncbi:dicarboxylate/amino acid:cation symporter [Paraburkholderia megapolitana]|uniref:Dicarboxylate/amino acid:cation (Na+ or H+) symporter, DAACS family n=1 Tax=Paraburkholderia megapolitana TaxID=420953 RepID=A0A1I3QDV2_9BURK|nr:dicarboxylate/amino acid:cation symporter [Paraburkholderia megapolitana]QDQ81186.1 dicarboxylate/amino acid:cation symporter [Paraburkholderia megapolitana]SFJ31507.1 dicarboxylate/amino acid:cation (Na+ or H+) symporter, DAACS family [Paraburkholderia megapolitana]